MAKKTTTMHMTMERETKKTVRFKETEGDNPHVFYVQKDTLKELGDPKNITITVTAP